MNDAMKYPSHELTLKLSWPSDQAHLAEGPHVVVELRNANSHTVASFSVPSDQLLQAVSQKLKCYPIMTPDGIVSVVSDETAEPLPPTRSNTIDQLVADGISSDMLDDEPNTANMLSNLRARLLKSLELVEKAITSLPKD